MTTTAPRLVLAPNPSPLTLDGTRTYLVGHRQVAVLDPGPARPAHVDAVVRAIGDAAVVHVLVTHDHPDHAAGAAALAQRLGTNVRSAREATLEPADRIETDEGELIAVATPGHTDDHLAFHWPAGEAVFCGDLLLGGQETALVAAPDGNLADYLESLERLRALRPRVIYPAHGPPFHEPGLALDAYVKHREQRLRAVVAALEPGPVGIDQVVTAVYGPELDAALRRAATASAVAYLEYLAADGRVRRDEQDRWTTA